MSESTLRYTIVSAESVTLIAIAVSFLDQFDDEAVMLHPSRQIT